MGRPGIDSKASAVTTAATVGAPQPVAQSRSFRKAQWRILLLVMFCYLFFYTGRQNFGFAAKGMQEDLGLSATAIGAFNAILLLGYGLGQAINGNLSDVYGARRMVGIGAFLSFVLNWCVSLTHSFTLAVVFWGANGYAQSTAWPAMNRALANWWPRRAGKAIGFYLLAAGFSSSLTFLLCILVIGRLDWRWVFRLPVTLMLVGGAVYLILARDRPEDEGFPALPPEGADELQATERESSRQRYVKVLRNRPFQLTCLSIGCESLARYGLLSWVPVHFLGSNWRQNTAGTVGDARLPRNGDRGPNRRISGRPLVPGKPFPRRSAISWRSGSDVALAGRHTDEQSGRRDHSAGGDGIPRIWAAVHLLGPLPGVGRTRTRWNGYRRDGCGGIRFCRSGADRDWPCYRHQPLDRVGVCCYCGCLRSGSHCNSASKEVNPELL